MSEPILEERVAHLEEAVQDLHVLVQELSSKLASSPQEKNWQRSVGKFKGDPIMKEIIEEGERIREEDRRRADG